MHRIMGPSIIGLFSIFGSLVVAGWYMAFKMNVVLSAAAGEQELPRLSTEDGIWDGVVVPFFRMLVTYIFASLPAAILMFILFVRMIGLLWLALAPPEHLLWPAHSPDASCGGAGHPAHGRALCLADDGAGSLLRQQRGGLVSPRPYRVRTILRSLPAYLLTVVAVYIAFGVEIAIAVRLWRGPEALEVGVDWMSVLVLPVLLLGLRIFFDVVAMRAIGSYYRCFKDKFAWSWG